MGADGVGPDGQIDVTGNTRTGLGQEQWMGHEKEVNESEVTLCLLYDFARTENKDSLSAAQRIVRKRKSRPEREARYTANLPI